MVNVVAVSHADIQTLISALAESALPGKNPVPDIRIFRQVGKLQIGKGGCVGVSCDLSPCQRQDIHAGRSGLNQYPGAFIYRCSGCIDIINKQDVFSGSLFRSINPERIGNICFSPVLVQPGLWMRRSASHQNIPVCFQGEAPGPDADGSGRSNDWPEETPD